MKHTLYLGIFDRCEDERALREGTRIISAYETPTGRVWIITERATSEVSARDASAARRATMGVEV